MRRASATGLCEARRSTPFRSPVKKIRRTQFLERCACPLHLRSAAAQRAFVFLFEVPRKFIDDFSSQAGGVLKFASALRIAALKSGILDPGNARDRGHELAPTIALRRQNFSAGGREPIITASPLARLLDPPPADPPPFFQAIKQRIERSGVETQRPARPQINELPNVIAMPRPIPQQRENEQLRASFLSFTIEY